MVKYICDRCKVEFKTTEKLLTYQRNPNSIIIKYDICEICDRIFINDFLNPVFEAKL
jgi:hypothetical protein